MLTVLIIVIDGIWDVWYVSWKCECLDGWICEASLWRWERSLSEKSCYTNIQHHSKGKFALIIRLPHLCFLLLSVLHFIFFPTLFRKLKGAKERKEIILSGETMMILMNTSGTDSFTIYLLVLWILYHY